MATKIEWCTETLNPVTGCTPAGEGCKNCYARAMALRLKAMGQPRYANGFEVTCHPEALNDPVLRKRKPQLIFVCSMGDLFHEKVPENFLDQVFAVMAYHCQHVFVVLTKRPKRMQAYLQNDRAASHVAQLVDARRIVEATGSLEWPLGRIWLGVSVSTQAEADERIPILLQCPAAKRIVSYGPALEPVDFSEWLPTPWGLCESRECGGCETDADECDDHKAYMKDRIDWLICGCESGPKRRHFDENWARDARDACREAGVPFFLKQTVGFGNKVKHLPFLDGHGPEEYP